MAEVCLATGKSLDVACFHCQQAAEKALKAWLTAVGVQFPFTHDLKRLLALCAGCEPGFQALEPLALNLNPFAVQTRYDGEFWPTHEEANTALQAARTVYSLVVSRFPPRPA